MPTGDPHYPYGCWCGIDHAADDYRLAYEDGMRAVGNVIDQERLARAITANWPFIRRANGAVPIEIAARLIASYEADR